MPKIINTKKLFLTVTLLLAGTPVLAELTDERQIVNTIHNVGFFADQGDWDQLALQFHLEGAVLDYTSYASASAGTSSDLPRLLPCEIVQAWKTVLPGYDRTHHLMGTESVQINGDMATVTSNVYATHILENEGEDLWVFIGDYRHELIKTDQGWKITLMQANLRAQLGNVNLPALAKARLRERSSAK
ncbi:MAG: nuclear transport factor 2 family protein [Pseudomonadota bacterium]